MTPPSCAVCRDRPATVGVLCEKCAGGLDGSVAIAPQQLQLRTKRAGDGALIDVWGQPHQLDPRTPVGRADISHGLVIVEPSVSRAHAVLEKRDAAWYVRDAGSSSGTFVNDKPVREIALATGDRVRFGDIEFFFVVVTTPLPPRPERFDAPTVRAPPKSTAPPGSQRPVMSFELQAPRGGGGGLVLIDGKPVQLTTPQYELMALLVARAREDAGKADEERGFVAMSELMRLSLDVSDPGDDHIRQLVRRVRRALLKAEIADLIEARRGVGYRLRVIPR